MLHYRVIEKRGQAEALAVPDGRQEVNPTVTCLVCLHGFLESASMWNVLDLDQFAKLILIDLPGHGKSDLAGIDSMEQMAKAVFNVLQKEQVDAYSVLGHSMGGYVALELHEFDQNCKNVILMNSNVWEDNKQKVADRKRVAKLVQTKKDRFVSEAIPNLFQSPENYPSEVAQLIQEATAMDAEAIARASTAMSQRRDFTEHVFSGAIPIQIIQGENDPIAPKERMEQIMLNQPENFHVVPSGHMAHFEATKKVRGILENSLRRFENLSDLR